MLKIKWFNFDGSSQLFLCPYVEIKVYFKLRTPEQEREKQGFVRLYFIYFKTNTYIWVIL